MCLFIVSSYSLPRKSITLRSLRTCFREVLPVSRVIFLEIISMTLARSVIEVGKGSREASSLALLVIAEKQLQERCWQRKKQENAVSFS